MRKIFILTGLLILGIAMVSYAYTIQAPHNKTNDITDCADCHGLPGYLPYDDSLCLSCHMNATGGGYSRNNAPRVLTHSSANTTPEGQPSRYGNWTIRCIDCHNQHVQLQTITHDAMTFLVTGTIISVSYDSTAGTTTFGYNNVSVNSPSWADPALWGRKSGNERGLVIYPKIADVNNPNDLEYATSYEIASATASTITVKDSVGIPSFSFATPSSFAIVYGQMVDITVFKPITELTPWQAFLPGVRFFNQTGPNSFAHNDMLIADNDGDGINEDSSPNGVCQICHYNTLYWRFDGSKAATGVHAGQNGTNCTTCHKHAEGFKASGACNTCHGFPPINNTSGGPNGLANNDGGTGSNSAGAHARHATAGPTGLNYSCETCHTGGMPASPIFDKKIQIGFDALGVYKTGTYNGRTAPLANGFTYISGAAVTTVNQTGAQSCSSIYCHSTGQGAGGAPLAASDYKTPIWTGSVQCGECHLGDGVQGNLSLMVSGSHGPHANAFIGLLCSECHNGSGSGTATHVNNNIEIQFSSGPYGNTGSYGQSPNTPGNGYSSCSNVYCHSVVQREGGTALVQGTSDYKTFTWGAAGSAACGSCHLDSNMSTGSHTRHLAAALSCGDCHLNAGALTTRHADYNIDVMFRPANGASAAYSQSPNTPGNGYGSCSSLNCHSDGKATPTYATVTWGATGAGLCVACHGGAGGTLGGANTALTSAHTLHTGSAAGQFSFTCDGCHSTVAGSNTTIINNTLHNNGTRNVSIATGFGGNGSNYSAASCSTTYCHGTTSPTWTSTATTGNCSLCHGMSNSATDGRDTNGDTAATDPQVGAHVVHLNASNNYSNPIACSECHTVPAGATYADRVKAAGHIDSALPAEVPMNGTLVRTEGAVPTYTAGTCSNLYCHGSTMGPNQGTGISPVWTNTAYLTGTPSLAGDCNKCHLAPPSTAPHSPTFTIDQCSQCHSHFNTNGTLNNKALHVDGTIQAAGGCNSCHGYPPAIGDGFPYRDEPVNEGKGAHAKHIANIAAAKGVTLNPATDSFGTGTAGIVCGTCHSNDPANHMSGTRVISFNGSNEYMFGLNAPIYNGIPGTSSTVNMKSCSNISCHYGTTPGWQNPATAGQ